MHLQDYKGEIESGVTWLDEEELKIVDAFLLSLTSNGFSLGVDYEIIKDYSKKFNLDSIEVLNVLKAMVGVYNKD